MGGPVGRLASDSCPWMVLLFPSPDAVGSLAYKEDEDQDQEEDGHEREAHRDPGNLTTLQGCHAAHEIANLK